MDTFIKYLKQFPNYNKEVIEAALPYLSERKLKPGEYFLSAGNVCKNIAFVKEGLLRLFYNYNGKEITNCFCKENTLTTSSTSLFRQLESDIAIQAIENTELITLSYHGIQQLYQDHPFWQQLGRLATENELVNSECHSRFLKDLTAKERYLQVLEKEKEWLQRVPLKYLASYLQIEPESLSRIRNEIHQT